MSSFSLLGCSLSTGVVGMGGGLLGPSTSIGGVGCGL